MRSANVTPVTYSPKSLLTMLWTIAVIVFVLWLLGFSFHLGGNLIHTLLVLVVIIVVVRLLT